MNRLGIRSGSMIRHTRDFDLMTASIRSTKIRFGLVMVIVLIAVVIWAVRNWMAEPTYAGKGIQEWIKELGYLESGRAGYVIQMPGPTGVVTQLFLTDAVPHFRGKFVAGQNTQSVSRIVPVRIPVGKAGATNMVILSFGFGGELTNPAKAIKSMGTSAIPYLCLSLRRQESIQNRWYARIYPILPTMVSSVLSPPSVPAFDERRAVAGLIQQIEPDILIPLPILIQATHDPDALVRSRIGDVIRRRAKYSAEARRYLESLPTTQQANRDARESPPQ